MQFKYTNLLLIEDDIDDQDFFIETLNEIDGGISCAIAKDGQKALQFLKKATTLPHLIILDLNMPVLSGYEFLQHLNGKEEYKDFRHIPAVVLTTAIRDEEKCLGLGASFYITKPSSTSLFKATLGTLLQYDVKGEAEELRKVIREQRKAAGKLNWERAS
jgi:CheY-like chemotaxis protein